MLQKGSKPGFWFSQLSSVTFTLHVQTKLRGKKERKREHMITINQLRGATGKELFVCSFEEVNLKAGGEKLVKMERIPELTCLQ